MEIYLEESLSLIKSYITEIIFISEGFSAGILFLAFLRKLNMLYIQTDIIFSQYPIVNIVAFIIAFTAIGCGLILLIDSLFQMIGLFCLKKLKGNYVYIKFSGVIVDEYSIESLIGRIDTKNATFLFLVTSLLIVTFLKNINILVLVLIFFLSIFIGCFFYTFIIKTYIKDNASANFKRIFFKSSLITKYFADEINIFLDIGFMKDRKQKKSRKKSSSRNDVSSSENKDIRIINREKLIEVLKLALREKIFTLLMQGKLDIESYRLLMQEIEFLSDLVPKFEKAENRLLLNIKDDEQNDKKESSISS